MCAFMNCKGFVMAATYAHKVYIELTFNGQLYMHFIDVTYNVRVITYAIFEGVLGVISTNLFFQSCNLQPQKCLEH